MATVGVSQEPIVLSEYGTTLRASAYIDSLDDPTFLLGIADIQSEAMIHIARAIQSVSVSFSMDFCPQVTVQLFDVNMEMLKNNYFSIGRLFFYKSSQRRLMDKIQKENDGPQQSPQVDNSAETELGYVIRTFELTSLSVSPGQGSSPSITLELRSYPIMQMKRDRKPGSINGKGHVFVQQAALAYGLDFYTQTTQKDKKINKASTDKRADSLWDVLSSLASEAKFSIFEVDGTLIFASMRKLYGLWGPNQFAGVLINEKNTKQELRLMNSWYVHYPYEGFRDPDKDSQLFITGVRQESKLADTLIPLQCPTFRRSDSDIYQVEGSMSLDRHSAMVLRPGMTIYVDGVPTFEDFYIITDVSFEHLSTSPVQISFRKPEREDKYVTDIPIGLLLGSDFGTSV